MSHEQRSGKKPFGRYRIEAVLGAGAMGEVYRGLDTTLQRRVAIKVPKRDQNSDAELMKRFLIEARAAARLSHRNICPVYDTGTIDGCNYITMKFVEGKPLSSYIQAGKQLPQRTVAHLVRKLAIALTEAHQQGIVHRDLKPANIMVDSNQEPVIMDFGLAHHVGNRGDERLTQTGTILGSPAYMSPEQVQGETGPASDIYSLGVIFYELLTGELPFTGSVTSVIAQIVANDPPDPQELRTDLDPWLREICLKMMAKQVTDRYASMQDVAAALTEYLKHTGKKTNTDSNAAASKDDRALAELFAALTDESKTAPAQAVTNSTSSRSDASLGGSRDRTGLRWQKMSAATRWIAMAFAALGLLIVVAAAVTFRGDKTPLPPADDNTKPGTILWEDDFDRDRLNEYPNSADWKVQDGVLAPETKLAGQAHTKLLLPLEIAGDVVAEYTVVPQGKRLRNANLKLGIVSCIYGGNRNKQSWMSIHYPNRSVDTPRKRIVIPSDRSTTVRVSQIRNRVTFLVDGRVVSTFEIASPPSEPLIALGFFRQLIGPDVSYNNLKVRRPTVAEYKAAGVALPERWKHLNESRSGSKL